MSLNEISTAGRGPQNRLNVTFGNVDVLGSLLGPGVPVGYQGPTGATGATGATGPAGAGGGPTLDLTGTSNQIVFSYGNANPTTFDVPTMLQPTTIIANDIQQSTATLMYLNGNQNVSGTKTFYAQPVFNTSIKIAGGLNGDILTSNASGVAYWASPSAGLSSMYIYSLVGGQTLNGSGIGNQQTVVFDTTNFASAAADVAYQNDGTFIINTTGIYQINYSLSMQVAACSLGGAIYHTTDGYLWGQSSGPNDPSIVGSCSGAALMQLSESDGIVIVATGTTSNDGQLMGQPGDGYGGCNVSFQRMA
jgi:hypothetical protein